jgi:hypothetical protein
LSSQIEDIFIGSNGIGAWQDFEINSLISESTKKKLPVIPVFLPDAPREVDASFLDTLGAVVPQSCPQNPRESLVERRYKHS